MQVQARIFLFLDRYLVTSPTVGAGVGAEHVRWATTIISDVKTTIFIITPVLPPIIESGLELTEFSAASQLQTTIL